MADLQGWLEAKSSRRTIAVRDTVQLSGSTGARKTGDRGWRSLADRLPVNHRNVPYHSDTARPVKISPGSANWAVADRGYLAGS
jgi:hypothetical protein